MKHSIIVLLIVTVLTSGCNNFGAKEANEVAWVITVGIDKAEDDDLLVTYRIANPQSQAEGSKDSAKEKSSVIAIKAPALAEARNLANASLSRTINLSHTAVILIGEDLARSGVQDAMGSIVRYREFRETIFLVVTKGKAHDVMKSTKPIIETLIARWVENSMENYSETSYYLPQTLHEFNKHIKTQTGTPLAVGYGLASNSQDRINQVTPGDNVKGYLPGDLPIEGSNTTQFTGVAVFKRDRLIGFLDTAETRALSILMNKFNRGFIVVKDPLDPKHLVSANIRSGGSPSIKVDTSKQPAAININIFLEGEITGIPSGINYESQTYLDNLEKQISDSIKLQISNLIEKTQEWQVDAADLGSHARSNFLTEQQLNEYNWQAHYADAAVNIEVKTDLRRAGLIRKTQELRKE